MTTVSFVATVYNKAAFLGDLIACLKAQDGEFEREYVFVDDGSKDDSVAVLRRLTADLPNTRIIERANGGQAKATNVGLFAARHDFIKLIDADDLLHTACTQRLLKALQTTPSAPLAYVEKRAFVDGKETPDTAAAVNTSAAEFINDPLRALFKTSIANPTQLMVRRTAIERTGGAEERVAHSMEYGLMLKLARLGPFVRVPDVLSFIRIGISGNLSENQRLTLQESMRHVLTFLRDHPDVPGNLQRQAAIRIAKRNWLWQARKRGAGPLSADSLRRLEAYAPFSDPVAIIEACAKAMDDTP